MVIRKLYRIESAHIVRNAYSERCSHSYHGHSGVIEVFLKSDGLDNAGMIYDFGALKQHVGAFLDMFDHSIHLWKEDKKENIDFFTKENNRYVILPCNPTAENYCVLFRDCINEILRQYQEVNGEENVRCCGVRYHETATGYAESEMNDPVRFHLSDLKFSPKTLEDIPERLKFIINGER